MDEFVMRYGVCLVLCIPGFILVIVSYLAQRSGRSGGWFLGGLLIAAGFLLSPHKWLALLGLIDYGYWGLPLVLITEHINGKRFRVAYDELGISTGRKDDSREMIVTIPERNEVLEYPFITCCLHELTIPRMLFSVYEDNEGRLFLLADKCTKGNILESMAFEGDHIQTEAFDKKKRNMTVLIEIKDKQGMAAESNNG